MTEMTEDLIREAREIGSDYKGWDCDGSASICDRRVALIDRLAALTTPQEVSPSENVAVARSLRTWTKRIRSELESTREAGIDLGRDYLQGIDSALMQAEEHAARIENDLYGEAPAPQEGDAAARIRAKLDRVPDSDAVTLDKADVRALLAEPPSPARDKWRTQIAARTLRSAAQSYPFTLIGVGTTWHEAQKALIERADGLESLPVTEEER